MYLLMPNQMSVGRTPADRLISTARWDEPAVRFNTVSLSPGRCAAHFRAQVRRAGRLLPIAMAKNAIGLAQDAEQYGASFFANGAAPRRRPRTPRHHQRSRPGPRILAVHLRRSSNATRSPSSKKACTTPPSRRSLPRTSPVPANPQIPDQRNRPCLPDPTTHDR